MLSAERSGAWRVCVAEGEGRSLQGSAGDASVFAHLPVEEAGDTDTCGSGRRPQRGLVRKGSRRTVVVRAAVDWGLC